MKLGERLQTIADMVPSGVSLADIGTDHAYLPIYLAENSIITHAVAGDIHHGPYISAKNAVAAAQLDNSISVRQGNGLEVVNPGEAEVVVIAGMGGGNITDILSSRPTITATVRRLILQPMIGAAVVRMWLHTNNWQIVNEQLVVEDGKLYQIIAAEPGESYPYEPILYEIGPLLWQRRHPLLKQHIQELANHLRSVLTAMAASPEAVQSKKYKEFTAKLRELEDKYACV